MISYQKHTDVKYLIVVFQKTCAEGKKFNLIYKLKTGHEETWWNKVLFLKNKQQ